MTYSYRERIMFDVYDQETGNIIVSYDDQTTAASHAQVLNLAKKNKEGNEQEAPADTTQVGEQASVPTDGGKKAGGGRSAPS